MPQREIAVIGAGLSGLAAAHGLLDMGLSPVVLEGRERVGGRVWSSTLENGTVAEFGAEWIMPGDEKLLGLAERFEIEAADGGVDYGRREPWGASAVTVEDQDAFLESARIALDELTPDAAAGRSLGRFLDELPGAEPARAAVKMRLQGTCAVELDQVTLLAARSEGAFESGPAVYRRLGRGNQRLPDAMAEELPDVRLGTVVDGIASTDGGVEVRIGSRSIEASAVIVAVPAPIAARLSFEPALPPELATALRELPMGVASKLAVATKKAPRLRAIQSTELPFWCWVAAGEGGQPRRCLTSFAGSRTAQDALGTRGVDPAPWFNRLRRMNPDLRFAGLPSMFVWEDDPFTLGAYSAWDAKSFARMPLFGQVVGRVAFAGEHTAGPEHAGTMEGAVRSGMRAAHQVAELLG